MLRPAAVVFDLIGTLVGFSAHRLDGVFSDMASALDLPLQEYQRACAAVRTDWEAGRFASVEAHAEHVCRALQRRPQASRITQAAACYLAFSRAALEPRPGALQTLRQLRDRGLPIGLITNCSSEIPLVWPDTPLAPLVDAAVFSCEACVRVRKPDPRIYAIACQRLGIAPSACLYVGDGGSGELSGAAAVGMTPLQLRVPDEDPRDAERLGREDWSGPRIGRLEDVLAYVPVDVRP